MGRAKSRFFQFVEFTPQNPDGMVVALRRLAVTGHVTEQVVSSFGREYIVDGVMHTPNELDVKDRSVLIVLRPGDPPHFVTAYPR